MTAYRRNFVPGGCFFFTVNLVERKLSLLTDHVELLRAAFRGTRRRHPTTIDAIVVLPDHLHTVWTLPEGDADFAMRWPVAWNDLDEFRFALPILLGGGRGSQDDHRFVRLVYRDKQVVVMKGRDHVHADAGRGEARGDGRQETYGIERGVNCQGDQARGECVAQSCRFGFLTQDDQRRPFLLAERQQRIECCGNPIVWRDCAEHEGARLQLRLHLSQQRIEIAFGGHHSCAFSGPS